MQNNRIDAKLTRKQTNQRDAIRHDTKRRKANRTSRIFAVRARLCLALSKLLTGRGFAWPTVTYEWRAALPSLQ